jgi:hypothetical protein
MKKFILNSTIVLALLITSCAKVEVSGFSGSWDWGGLGDIKLNVNNFYSIALTYIKIPSNRYFIYKDESTGAFDSVYVTNSSVGLPNAPISSSPLFAYQTFTLTLMYAPVSGTQPWLTGFANCDSVYRSPLFIDSDFALTNTQTNLPCFWFPFTSSGISQYSFMPTLSIEGIQYNAVHKFSATNGLQPTHPSYLQTTHYWVKEIGIIKKEIRTNNSIKTSLLVRFG